eukprot:12424802-Karenia_brevis.AAC.1
MVAERLCCEGSCKKPPQTYYSKGLSDHSPLVMTIQVRKCGQQQIHPIPAWVTKLPEFKRRAKRLFAEYADQKMPARCKMRHIKPRLREIAKEVRNNSIDSAGCAEAKDTLLASVARCVARG